MLVSLMVFVGFCEAFPGNRNHQPTKPACSFCCGRLEQFFGYLTAWMLKIFSKFPKTMSVSFANVKLTVG